MSGDDFNLMLAYDRIEPFGAMRDDLRMGIALSSYHNAQSKDNNFKPMDFMPFIKKEEQENYVQTVDEQIAVMRALTEHQRQVVEQ